MLTFHHAVPKPGTFSFGCHHTSYCMVTVRRDDGDTNTLWCVVRRRYAAPCEFPSLPLFSCGVEHKESVFDLSTKPLHLTNIKFTSMPSIVSSGDHGLIWVDGTPEELTAFDSRAP